MLHIGPLRYSASAGTRLCTSARCESSATPMWSIALECQIYVVFALLLVPVWRRFGPWAQLAVALAIGLAPQLLFRGALAYTAPWLLGLFAMGVVAARGRVRITGWLRW